ncbi:MAG: FkbM family methyltransferase, partial [Chitinophagaceae bacterium]
GKLYAVEPVIPFNEILQWRLRDKKHVTILPYALGTEEKKITLVIPKNLAYLSTGLPNVYDEASHGSLDEYGFKFEATMKRGSELFKDLQRLDFLKCDIEGYEEYVFPEMKPVFEKHKPIIQVETWGKHKNVVEDFLNGLGYTQYHLEHGKLKPSAEGHSNTTVDFIFVHPQNQAALEKVVKFKA